MTRTRKAATIPVSLTLILVLGMLLPGIALGITCEEGTSRPPFLGTRTVTPNVLLMLDNSASMYDLAEVEDVKSCFDDTYDNTRTDYAGYFEQDEWYAYTGSQFEAQADETAARSICTTAAGTMYRSDDVCATMNNTGTVADPVYEITAFASTGKFMNWAATSKMDIQKWILTGGKYSDYEGVDRLYMEARGCAGNRMIKETALTEPVSGDSYTLTLGIRGDVNDTYSAASPCWPECDEENFTLIDIYEITETGVDQGACQQAIDYLVGVDDPTKLNQGTLKQYVDACLGNPGNNTDQGDSNAAFNHVIHACWYQIKHNTWPPGGGTVQSMKNACERIYSNMASKATPGYSWEITSDNSGFGCYGKPTTQEGYAGRCWNPGAAVMIPFNEEEDGQEQFAGIGRQQEFEEIAQTEIDQQDLQVEESRFGLIDALRDFVSNKGSFTRKRQNVLQAFYDFLVADAEAAPIVMADPSTRTGWASSNALNKYGSKSYSSSAAGAQASWERYMAVAGMYRIRVWAACEKAASGGSDPDVTYTIVSDLGSTDITGVDQGAICGAWYTLGEYHFNDIDQAQVIVTNVNGTHPTNADALEFELTVEDTTTTTSTTTTTTTTSTTSTSTTSTSTTTTTLPGPVFGTYNPMALTVLPSPAVVYNDGSTVTFTVVFNLDVKNFNTSADLVISTTGTVSYTTGTISGGPRIYTVDINNITGAGTLSLGVKTWITNWTVDSANGTFNQGDFNYWHTYGTFTGDYEVRIEPDALGVIAYDSVGTQLPTHTWPNPLPNRTTDWMVLGVNPGDYFSWFDREGWSDFGHPGTGPGDWQLGDKISFTVATGGNIRNADPARSAYPVTFSEIGTVIKEPPTTTTTTTSTTTTSTSTTTTSTSTTTTTLFLPPGSGWFDPTGGGDPDACVEQAMKDFCGALEVPQVIDPSDIVVGTGGSFSGVPAFLADMGTGAQLGEPLYTMKGKVAWTGIGDPRGLIHKYAKSIRIGLMTFNDVGDETECDDPTDPDDLSLFTSCSALGDTQDGATIEVPVDYWNSILWGFNHNNVLTWTINTTKAATWTPLSEAIHTGIGYFGEKMTYTDGGGSEQDYRINGLGDYRVIPYAPGWAVDVEYDPGSVVRVGNNYYRTTLGGVSSCSGAPCGPSPSGDNDGGVAWADITADIDTDMPGTTPQWNPSGTYPADDGDNSLVLANNQYYYTHTGGTSSNPVSGDIGDDAGVTWTKLSGPVLAECQSNNIIIITEGASTADINATMLDFASTIEENGAPALDDSDDVDGCDDLLGSTLFDDYTAHGYEGTNIYALEPFGSDSTDKKSNINTFIVQTGSERVGLTGECSPDTLLIEAADQGSDDGVVFDGSSPTTLHASLDALFASILTKTSSGSAASVISASRGGEGALYQAIFWPDKIRGYDGLGRPIHTKWTGEVHSFLVDASGILYLDTYPAPNGNKALESADINGDGIPDTLVNRDQPVVIFYDSANEATLACYGEIETNDPADPKDDTVEFFDVDGDCRGATPQLHEIRYLWNTNDWLNNEDVDNSATPGYDITRNRSESVTGWNLTAADEVNLRYIFTWNDLNNNGAVDQSTEVLPFTTNLGKTSTWLTDPFAVVSSRGPVNVDFDIPSSDPDAAVKVNRIINWIRGKDLGPLPADTIAAGVPSVDLPSLRTRAAPGDHDGDGDIDEFDTDGDGEIDTYEMVTWRLGDVVHSTPLSVGSPAENYHLLYRDFTYAEFVSRYEDRRHMIYFGANDGMLHAVNGGFFNESQKKFCRRMEQEVDANSNGIADLGEDINGNGVIDGQPVCATTVTGTMELGAELWAYVPYNLLPHLGCLTDPDYGTGSTDHKYFVDLRPRIFDVKIFKEETACTTGGFKDPDCIHPNGWGTILVGGMRFGGSKVKPSNYWVDVDADGAGDPGEILDNREFTSAYFVFDITNPEQRPTLLGEFTRTIDDADGDGVIEDLDGDGVLDESSEVELGYTTVISTMVPMVIGEELDADGDNIVDSGYDKNCNSATVDIGNGSGVNTPDPAINRWHLILGSGPTEVDGTSEINGSVSVVPLERLVSKDAMADPVKNMRIPARTPYALSEISAPLVAEDQGFGSIEVPESDSFISDLITVDMQVQEDYLADVVYFGTISGDWYPTGWGGTLHRLVTRDETLTDLSVVGCGTIKQIEMEPSEWLLKPLIEVDQPITSAATVGTDGLDFWVYFGTGRFFHANDKTDDSSNATQTYYGIREPVNSSCRLSWEQVWNNRTDGSCTSDPRCPDVSFGTYRGTLGLLRTDQIDILSTKSVNTPNTLICKGDADPYSDVSCLPPEVLSTYTPPGTRAYMDLINYVSGTDILCSGTGTMGLDGWYREFPEYRERNLGQATLLGGLVSYTSYRPFTDICKAEGLGYLYGMYYQTGTPWIEDVFGTVPVDSEPRKTNPERMDLGEGLSTTPNIHVGQEEGGKAFIQTSVGKIKEIPQPNLPNKHVKSGRVKWRDIER